MDIVADLRGVLVTADALHCQRAHAAYLAGLAGRGAHYALTMKRNQPALRHVLAHQP